MLHRNAAGQIVPVPVTCPKHQKTLTFTLMTYYQLAFQRIFYQNRKLVNLSFHSPLPSPNLAFEGPPSIPKPFCRSPHTQMADASVCSEVPTQGDILPGFLNAHLGLTGLQTKNGNAMVYSLLEFSSKQLGNICQQLKQSLSSDMLLCVRYTGSTSDPVSKISTEGQRLILMVAETYEQTKIP